MTVAASHAMVFDSQPADAGLKVIAIVAAYNEADRIEATLQALAEGLPDSSPWVADDGSTDGTAALARAGGARVVRSERTVGKGGAVTLAARELLETLAAGEDPVVVLCDGDLADSAALLGPLVEAVARGEADLAVAAFARRVGGGFGVALRFARWAIHAGCGLTLDAPLSGQRALRASTLHGALPFGDGYGMEVAMTIDVARAGGRVAEIELDLQHRSTGRTLSGFLHRAGQLRDIARVYRERR
jgi:glycosyltransferase involved in cell wall biosynthesis